MCGIIASIGGDTVANTLEQYNKQKGRGQQGFGLVALKGGKRVAFERATTEASIKALMMSIADLKPDTILFHHRFPTSTANLVEAAHPLPISKKGWQHRYWMLHNGVVSGQDAGEIKKDGYKLKSRIEEIRYLRTYSGRMYSEIVDSEVNDSEYLGYYVASFLEGKRQDIPMSGAIACFVLQENKKTGACQVFAMRNYMNPIEVVRSKDKGVHTLQLSSEGKKGATLEPHKIWHVDMQTLKLSEHKAVNIGKKYEVTTSKPTGYYATEVADKEAAAIKAMTSPLKSKYTEKDGVLYVDGKPSALNDYDDGAPMTEGAKLQLEADAAYDIWQEATEELRDPIEVDALYKEYVTAEMAAQMYGQVEAQSAIAPAFKL